MSGGHYNSQPAFGDKGTFTTHGTSNPINGLLDQSAPHVRRQSVSSAKVVPMNDTQANIFSAQRGDLVFQLVHKKGQSSKETVRAHVVVTANGVDPDKFTEEYAYRGVCLAPAEFSEGAKLAPVAYTMQGKMQQLNTGTEAIHAGDEVEYYAMSVEDAKKFMLVRSTKRVPLGLRKLKPVKNQTGVWLRGGVTKENRAQRAERLFGVQATAHGTMRWLRGNVIGTALTSAAPGANFDIMLKPPV